MGTHYDTLGVEPSASRKDIRAAYLQLCKRYHPDKLHASIDINEETLKRIIEAYETLSDVNKRRAYDSQFDLFDSVVYSAVEAMTSFCGLFQACARVSGEVFRDETEFKYHNLG